MIGAQRREPNSVVELGLPSSRGSLWHDPVGVVENAVADGVGRGRGEVVVPLGRRQLAGDDGRPLAGAVFEDLEEIAPFLVGGRRQPPVVEDQDVDPSELGEEADIGPVGPGEGEVVKQPRGAPVVGAEACG